MSKTKHTAALSEFDPAAYRDYIPDLDKLAERLAPQVAASDAEAMFEFDRTIDLIARNGYTCTYSKELGGQAAAWSAMEHVIAAGCNASCRRVTNHEADGWILHVAAWLT